MRILRGRSESLRLGSKTVATPHPDTFLTREAAEAAFFVSECIFMLTEIQLWAIRGATDKVKRYDTAFCIN